ncbi:MAG: flavin monoamine oxidase family protein [Gemmatimonadota bacterium]
MPDILVIGGGLAGLAAAARLLERGHGVTLVEARPRLGGRAWSVERPGTSPVELGAEWVADDGVVRELGREHGIQVVAAHGRWLRRIGSGWQEMDGLPDLTADLLARMRSAGGADRALSAALARCCGAAELTEARTLLLSYVEGFHAADPARLSVRWLDEVEATQPADASTLRLPEGTGRLVEALAASLDGAAIHVGTEVRTVRWRKGHVAAEWDGGTWEGEAAIVTVPLSILKADGDDSTALRFDPPLADARAAAARLEMGAVVKLGMSFREPFWRSAEPLRHALFFHGFGQPFPTWWTPPDPAEARLTAWAGGPAASRLAAAGPDELVDIAVRSLAGTIGIPAAEIAAQVEQTWFHDWNRDRLTRGAYSYVAVGGTRAHAALARPVEDTIYLAGEATAGHGLNATMEGAIESGRRAADAAG